MTRWLIRTKDNHIIGPISKDKLVELVHNKSVTLEDEVCSGNGYWFYLHEQELVESFLFGEEQQPFNPLSEIEEVEKEREDIRKAERVKKERDVTTLVDLDELKKKVKN